MVRFEDFDYSTQILNAIKDRGFESPTEVQQKSFEPVMEGRDVVVLSKTGSGKTAAFGLPLIELLKDGEHGLRGLVMAPTRELAKQVCEDLESYAKYTDLKFALVYGGVGMEPQVKAIREADIVVGTPGRILDHLDQGTLSLENIFFLVLDEADRMLDMGFIDDVKRIISAIPSDHVTMLFSATMPDQIREIADRLMVEPVNINCESFVSDALLRQYYVNATNRTKLPILRELIARENPGLAIVFCATRGLTDSVEAYLRSEKMEAHAIHGGLSQAKREKVLQGFHDGTVHVLVATDVAARGLDIPEVTHIFNYNVPKTVQEYTHRMGRTARAGKEGKVITLLASDEHEEFGPIEAYFRGKIEAYDLGNFDPKPVHMPRRPENEGAPRRFGNRSGGNFRSGPGYRSGGGYRSSSHSRPHSRDGQHFGNQGENRGSSKRSFYGAKN